MPRSPRPLISVALVGLALAAVWAVVWVSAPRHAFVQVARTATGQSPLFPTALLHGDLYDLAFADQSDHGHSVLDAAYGARWERYRIESYGEPGVSPPTLRLLASALVIPDRIYEGYGVNGPVLGRVPEGLPGAGNLLLAAGAVWDGHPRRCYFSISTTDGTTWSEPIRLHDPHPYGEAAGFFPSSQWAFDAASGSYLLPGYYDAEPYRAGYMRLNPASDSALARPVWVEVVGGESFASGFSRSLPEEPGMGVLADGRVRFMFRTDSEEAHGGARIWTMEADSLAALPSAAIRPAFAGGATASFTTLQDGTVAAVNRHRPGAPGRPDTTMRGVFVTSPDFERWGEPRRLLEDFDRRGWRWMYGTVSQNEALAARNAVLVTGAFDEGAYLGPARIVVGTVALGPDAGY